MKAYIINTENVEEIFKAENLEKAKEKVLSEIDIQEKDMVETGEQYTAQELINESNYDKNELKDEKKKLKIFQ